ncbi:DNA cytosine methyltransferase [Ornithinimicrobium sp. LYQ92]|uniref:DNA cytosine methyltransferase n=1 Tax=Serinicoccus sp. LYQ92 TaxID=3378798 RepID=UPI0038519D17
MLTLTDLFCGAGGSSTGAIDVPGVQVRVASNHWQLAIDTHNSNHQDADHICADLSQISPPYFPATDLLWASPECTNHSRAKGRKRDTLQTELWGEALPDEAADRSRATMWDVVRFTEHHRYQAIIVENVVEAADWLPFQAWLLAMDSLGYHHQVVSLNSMHAAGLGDPAPQSRDRLYVVFHRKGNVRPDFQAALRPKAYCDSCDTTVAAMQAWKRPDHTGVGRYRSQYVYRCPNVACRNQIVEPAWLPASTIIDWDIPGQRIGDRARPLAEKTRKRIAAGIARYWTPIHLEAAGNTYDAADPKHARHGDPNSYYRAWSVDEPLRTLHTIESKALAVPVEGRDGKVAQSMERALRTQTTRLETGLAYPAPPFIAELRGGGSTARPAAHPLATLTASGNHHALITSYYGSNTRGARPTSDPLDAVTTTARHALLMRNNTARGDQGQMSTPIHEVARTITTTGHQSLLTPGDIAAAEAHVDDVLFRMLEPAECARAMAFPTSYVMLGNRREQVRLAGNAVTPPAARDLIACVVATLTDGAAA